jgi:hypothetical protein
MVISYGGKAYVRISHGDTTVALNPPAEVEGKKLPKAGANIGLISLRHIDFANDAALSYGEKSPFIIAGVGVGIKTPSQQNSEVIYHHIFNLLTDENPVVANTISIKLKSKNSMTLRDYLFSIFWVFTILLAFGIIWLGLGKLHFNILSKGIFVFFIAIISFLSYRIYQTANTYTVVKKQNLFTPLFEFFFIPIIRVGRSLTEGFAQINFILLIVDFIIEAPFKIFVEIAEEWTKYVRERKDQL